MIYTIYHIPGIKVGCTTDLERRTRHNICKYGQIEVETLEVFDGDVEAATKKEQEWAKKLGYKGGRLYRDSPMLSRVHREDSKAKISAYYIANGPNNTGKKRSELAKARARKSREENPRVYLSGKDNPLFGRKLSPETRAKLSLAAKNRKHKG